MFFAAMPESGKPKCRLLRYRIHPVIKEIVLEELEGLDDETRAELEAMFGIGGRDEK